MLNNISKSILEVSDVKALIPDFSKLKIIPEKIAHDMEAVIFDSDGINLKILTTNNFSENLKQLYSNLDKKNFKYTVYYTSKEWIDIALNWYNQSEKEEAQKLQKITKERNVKWIDAISMIKQVFEKKDSMDPGDFIMEVIRLWYQSGASDIHFQPEESGVVIKLRIDWVLQIVLEMNDKDFFIYLQKLKFISWTKMNISAIPQDGRFSFEVNIQWIKKNIDVRASFMPWMGIESTVLRYLDSTQSLQTFEGIGFWGQMYDEFQAALKKNYGMILLTWPTWSWKTTTLYSILNYVNDGKKKIITLEDPIEYKLKWIQQSQINYSKNYDYETWLKACLRHDPDIILVWETRTLETAEITLNASLTWHLVFTTLHTNSAIEAITRFTNMWIEPYMLAPALLMVQGQRLLRKVCPHCWTMRKATDVETAEITKNIAKINEVRQDLALTFDWNIPHAQGCAECNHTGYIWRIAAVEVLTINEKIKKAIVAWWSTADILTYARQSWFLTLQEDWYIKMLNWITTLEELRRTL